MTRNAVEELHRAFNELAPDGAAQAHMAEIRTAMERDNLPPTNVALAIASAIVDGLRHGNWPGRQPR